MVTKELLKRIRKIEIVTTRLVNEQIAGQYHSVFKGRGMSFSGVCSAESKSGAKPCSGQAAGSRSCWERT